MRFCALSLELQGNLQLFQAVLTKTNQSQTSCSHAVCHGQTHNLAKNSNFTDFIALQSCH